MALLVSFHFAKAQTSSTNTSLFLLTDRDYCLSGDTLWFSVFMPDANETYGNVVRVQLDNQNNQIITSAIVKNKNGISEGYLHIPDSLSTGICFVSAFLNTQRANDVFSIKSKALFVFNRFEESLFQLEIPENLNGIAPKDFNTEIEINTLKTQFQSREIVKGNIQFPAENISFAVVKANLVNPAVKEISGDFNFMVQGKKQIPDFAENNGFLVSGTVQNKEGMELPNTLITLSVPGESPHFDYYYTNKSGDFHFFLKEALGSANVVLQPISEKNIDYQISLEQNTVHRMSDFTLQTKILQIKELNFIETFLSSNYIHKIFHPSLTVPQLGFEMPARFNIPFYGEPSFRIFPDEFFDLPNFQEISGELLSGVQYRVKDGNIFFRMLNDNQDRFFENEPLRLLNGIPVFKNSLLAELQSTDIKYIDVVQEERIFGDLIFMGVLAVTLNNQSNSWLVQQPNVFQFKVNGLQEKVNSSLSNFKAQPPNLPDVRTVFLWENKIDFSDSAFDFQLSDLKGQVEIVVEGITKNNEVFRASKLIEVK